MDEKWIDEKLPFLAEIVGKCQPIDPTPIYAIYTGSEKSLYKMNDTIRSLLGIPVEIDVTFVENIEQPGNIRMSLQKAHLGGMTVKKTVQLKINVHNIHRGRVEALGGILAHECSHAFLFINEVQPLKDKLENEMFVDLTAIALGLGLFLLNGKRVNQKIIKKNTSFPHLIDQISTFGYLDERLIVYAMKKLSYKIPLKYRLKFSKIVEREEYIEPINGKVYLKFFSGKEKLLIEGDERVFGRNDFLNFVSGKDILNISRSHFKITKINNRYFIEDMSKGGTKVNGQSITGKGKVYLSNQSKIEIPHLKFIFNVREER